MDFGNHESVELLVDRIEKMDDPVRRALEANSYAHQAKDCEHPKLASYLFRIKVAAIFEAKVLGLVSLDIDRKTKMIIIYYRNGRGEKVRAALHIPIVTAEKYIREKYRKPNRSDIHAWSEQDEKIELERLALEDAIRDVKRKLRQQPGRRRKRR